MGFINSYTLAGVEPGKKFMRRCLKFAVMILAFVVVIVFGEFYRRVGWVGALIFVIGAADWRFTC